MEQDNNKKKAKESPILRLSRAASFYTKKDKYADKVRGSGTSPRPSDEEGSVTTVHDDTSASSFDTFKVKSGRHKKKGGSIELEFLKQFTYSSDNKDRSPSQKKKKKDKDKDKDKYKKKKAHSVSEPKERRKVVMTAMELNKKLQEQHEQAKASQKQEQDQVIKLLEDALFQFEQQYQQRTDSNKFEKWFTANKKNLPSQLLLNAEPKKNQTLLQIFCYYGHQAFASAIVEHLTLVPFNEIGVGLLSIYDTDAQNAPWDINHKDINGMTCLHCAAYFPTSSTYIKQSKKFKSSLEDFWARKEKICETLILNKETLLLDLDAKDKDGNTVLHHLFQSLLIVAEDSKGSPFSATFLNLVALLLRKGINVNSQNKAGNTPLHVLLEHSRLNLNGAAGVKLVLRLLDHKANPNIQNSAGETCLFLASKHGHTQLVTLMLDYWADYTILTQTGESPIPLANYATIRRTLEAVTKVECDIVPSLGRLPRQLLLNIFSFLEIPDLINLSYVCHYLFRITSDENLWHSIAMVTFQGQATNENCWKRYCLNRLFPKGTRKSRDTKPDDTMLSVSSEDTNESDYDTKVKQILGRGPLVSPTLERPMVKHRPPTRKLSVIQKLVTSVKDTEEDVRIPKKRRNSFLKLFSPSNSPMASPGERKEPKISNSPSPLSRRFSLPSLGAPEAISPSKEDDSRASPPPSPKIGAREEKNTQQQPIKIDKILKIGTISMENLVEKKDPATPPFITKDYDTAKVLKVQSLVRRWLCVRALSQRKMMAKRRYQLVQEFATSERSYVDILRNTVACCLVPLRDHAENFMTPSQDKQTFLKRVQDIFSVIEEMVEFNMKLLDDIELKVKNWHTLQTVGDLILTRLHHFRFLYQGYIANFPIAKLKLLNEIESNPYFATFVRNRRWASQILQNKDLGQLLILPLQRFSEYRNMLAQIADATWKTHADHYSVAGAVTAMNDLEASIVERQKELENKDKVIRIQEVLVGKCEIVQPSRTFVSEGEVTIRNKQRDNKYYWFLFNDVLLYTEFQPKVQKYKYIDMVDLACLSVNPLQKEANIFELTCSTSREYTGKVYCQNSTEKQRWCELLSIGIDKQRTLKKKAKKLDKSQRGKDTSGSPSSYSSGEDVNTISSSSVPTGLEISTPFNVSHTLHVDPDLIWSGTDPTDAFELEEELGRGSFGAVYKARHKESSTYFAIKILDLDRDDDPELIENEINILKACKHHNIVQYYGVCSKNNKIWILMDFCELGSVRSVMEVLGVSFEEDQIAAISFHILMGLDYLHNSKKIIHRDIKPANVLLNQRGHVCIGDFGISSKLVDKMDETIGTSLYMSPEVIQGTYNEKADIWSLGICLIEMADGFPPNHRFPPAKAMQIILSRPPPSLKDPKKWSPEMNDFLVRCLTKDPKFRASAIELLTHPFIMRYIKSTPKVIKKIIDDYVKKPKKVALPKPVLPTPQAEEVLPPPKQSSTSSGSSFTPSEREEFTEDSPFVSRKSLRNITALEPGQSGTFIVNSARKKRIKKKGRSNSSSGYHSPTQTTKQAPPDPNTLLLQQFQVMLQATMLSVQEQMRQEIQKVKQEVVEEFKREVQESEKRIMEAVQQHIQSSRAEPKAKPKVTTVIATTELDTLNEAPPRPKGRKFETFSAARFRRASEIQSKIELFESLHQSATPLDTTLKQESLHIDISEDKL